MKQKFRSPCHQEGMALIVSLVLLLSMTLLALAAMQNTSLEERMAGNVRSENIALQAAESALRSAEGWLESLQSLPSPGDGGPYWFRADGSRGPNAIRTGTPWWTAWLPTDWDSHATPIDSSLSLVFVEATKAKLSAGRLPSYVVEEDGLQRGSLVVGQQQDVINQGNRFRITARGLDEGGRGEVLLQTRFVRRF